MFFFQYLEEILGNFLVNFYEPREVAKVNWKHSGRDISWQDQVPDHTMWSIFYLKENWLYWQKKTLPFLIMTLLFMSPKLHNLYSVVLSVHQIWYSVFTFLCHEVIFKITVISCLSGIHSVTWKLNRLQLLFMEFNALTGIHLLNKRHALMALPHRAMIDEPKSTNPKILNYKSWHIFE